MTVPPSAFFAASPTIPERTTSQAGERLENRLIPMTTRNSRMVSLSTRALGQFLDGVENQHTDADPDPGEGIFDELDLREIGKKSGNHRDNHQGREDHAKCCDEAAGIPFRFMPMKVAVLTAMTPGVHCPTA